MVPGVILAAGRSARMGRSKALLPFSAGGEPFVVRLGRALIAGGVSPLSVVGREDDPDLRDVVSRELAGARFIANPNADRGGQLSSIVAAVDAFDVQDVAGILMTPIDVPRVRPETVRALLAAFDTNPGRIVRAVHLGAHGHPVIFPREMFGELRSADPVRGAKAVVQAHSAAVIDVEVPDAGVVDDIDTPDDYRRLFS